MSSSVDEAILEMKKFIEECGKVEEELKKQRNPKLRELAERLYKKTLKEERDDDALLEMKRFIEECNKAEENIKKEQSHKLTELIERLNNFKTAKSIYGQAAREVMKA